jgi:arabinoxylan arabinofuranohydrolase
MFYPTKAIRHAAPAIVLAVMAITGLHAETNPIIKNIFTADPAAMVYGDTVYLYVGHDEAKGREMFTMKQWLCYSSKDMKS